MSFFIHPTAIADEGCTIGEGTHIWHFSHLSEGCIIGCNCIIGQNVFIGRNVRLGNNVKVQNNVSLYEGVYCEDDVFIGPSAVFTNIINPRSTINRKKEFKPTVIKRGATIGANATIVCGVEIGEFAFVGAGAVVTKNVLPSALMIGNPARASGWVSEAGNKLLVDEAGNAVCPETGTRYILSNGVIKKLDYND